MIKFFFHSINQLTVGKKSGREKKNDWMKMKLPDFLNESIRSFIIMMMVDEKEPKIDCGKHTHTHTHTHTVNKIQYTFERKKNWINENFFPVGYTMTFTLVTQFKKKTAKTWKKMDRNLNVFFSFVFVCRYSWREWMVVETFIFIYDSLFNQFHL